MLSSPQHRGKQGLENEFPLQLGGLQGRSSAGNPQVSGGAESSTSSGMPAVWGIDLDRWLVLKAEAVSFVIWFLPHTHTYIYTYILYAYMEATFWCMHILHICGNYCTYTCHWLSLLSQSSHWHAEVKLDPRSLPLTHPRWHLDHAEAIGPMRHLLFPIPSPSKSW